MTSMIEVFVLGLSLLSSVYGEYGELGGSVELPCNGTDPPSDPETITWEFSNSTTRMPVGTYEIGVVWTPDDEWSNRTDVTSEEGVLSLTDIVTSDNGIFHCIKSTLGGSTGVEGNTPLGVYLEPTAATFHLCATYTDFPVECFDDPDCADTEDKTIDRITCSSISYPASDLQVTCGGVVIKDQSCDSKDAGNNCTITVEGDRLLKAGPCMCSLQYSSEPVGDISWEKCLTISTGSVSSQYKVCEEKHFPASISLNVIAIVVCIIVIVLLLLWKKANICVLVVIVVIVLLLVTGGAIAMGLCEAWKTDAGIPPMGNATIAMMALSVLALLVVIVVVLFTGSKIKENSHLGNSGGESRESPKISRNQNKYAMTRANPKATSDEPPKDYQ